MSVRFEALEPSYDLTGNAPTYHIQFLDEGSGNLKDPDSVDKLEVVDNSSDTILRTFVSGEITKESTGKYKVQDETIDDPNVLELRWTYTDDGTQETTSTAFEVVDQTLGSSEKQIKDDVLRQLGKGRVRVELPAGTLDFCLRKAKRWYAMHLGQKKNTTISMSEGTNTYSMPSDTFYVVEAIFPSTHARATDALGYYGLYGWSSMGMDAMPASGMYSPGGASGFYSSIVQALQYADTSQRVLGNEPTWEYVPLDNELWIYPAPSSSGKARVDYVSSEVDLQNMTPQEYMFIEEYTLAEAMIALGRIRGKFSGGFPAAQSSRTLDGDMLIGDGDQKKQELDEKIKYWAPTGWLIKG